MPSMTITIPDDKYNEYKQYFLMAFPNQTADSDSPMTDDQWVKHRIILFARGAYQKGKMIEHEQNQPIIDKDIVT